MQEKSAFRSIIGLKCPHCRKGDMFVRPGLFVYKDIFLMHENCKVCDQKFEIEPGFWIGALWTSYPFIVLIISPFILMAISGEDINIWFLVGLMIVSLLMLIPLTIRLGRSIWIHIFVRYKK